jgi:hypothetical protein
MTLTPRAHRDHGRIHPRAYRHLPHQSRAQHLLRPLQLLRHQWVAHCTLAHILACFPLPYHVHRMFSDPHAEPDMGRFPAACRAGSAKLHRLSPAGTSRHFNGRIGMVRPPSKRHTFLVSSLM